MSTSVPGEGRNHRAPGRARARAAALLLLPLALACRGGAVPAPVQPGVAVPQLPTPAAGRGSIAGVVVDSATGHVAWGVAVYFTADSVIGTGRATPRRDLPADTTGRDGAFALRDLPAGRYTLATDGLGYIPLRQIVIVRAGLVHSLVLRPRRRAAP